MNSKVDCAVYDCMYNSTGTCAANEISICGSDATEVDSTCCGTFSKGSMTNSIADQAASGTFIGCDVTNCIHHADHKCKLSEIQVDACICSGTQCSCESETCCDSFQCR